MANNPPAASPSPPPTSSSSSPAAPAAPVAPVSSPPAAPPEAPASPAAPVAPAAPEVSDSVSTTHDGEDKAVEQVKHGVTVDHGEPDPRVEADKAARLAAAQDPWGTTPVQMRDDHDETVDPAVVGIATRPDGTGLVDAPSTTAYDGLNPDAVGEQNSPQGTLPPV